MALTYEWLKLRWVCKEVSWLPLSCPECLADCSIGYALRSYNIPSCEWLKRLQLTGVDGFWGDRQGLDGDVNVRHV
jgi:hypothetical protein